MSSRNHLKEIPVRGCVQLIPGQTVLLSSAAERVHLHALDVSTGLDCIGVRYQIWQTCRRITHKSINKLRPIYCSLRSSFFFSNYTYQLWMKHLPFWKYRVPYPIPGGRCARPLEGYVLYKTEFLWFLKGFRGSSLTMFSS